MSRNLSELKIGYAPNSLDLQESGDRRRFCSYAKHKGFQFEIADVSKDYDIVFLTYHCDIPKWIEYKKRRGSKTYLIYELVDSYLSEDRNYKSKLRGVLKYLDKSSSKLYKDYRTGIIELASIADAIVCTTQANKKLFSQYCPNVHVILDVVDEEVETKKQDFHINGKLKLVWEGQCVTVHNILQIADVLNELKEQVELHVITDPNYYRYSKKYIKRPTEEILAPVQCDKYFYKWETSTFSDRICEGDLAIIPIDMGNKMAVGKPENKLILFWNHRIPTMVSATPSYVETMDKAGLNGYLCSNAQDWKDNLKHYIELSSNDRNQQAEQACNFAATNHSKLVRFREWDALMRGCLLLQESK